jgi:hypothetical protein
VNQLRLFDMPPCCPGDVHRVDCVDCGVDTINAREYYIVRDEVWPLDPCGGMLCVGCLEERIGRRLTPADFTDCPLNTNDRRSSKRLRSRLGPDWTVSAVEMPW